MQRKEIDGFRKTPTVAGGPCIPTLNQRLQRGAYSLPNPPRAKPKPQKAAKSCKVYEFKLTLFDSSQGQAFERWMTALPVQVNRQNALMNAAQQLRWRQKSKLKNLPPSLKLTWRKGKLIGCGTFVSKKTGAKACPVSYPHLADRPKDIEAIAQRLRSAKNYQHEALVGIPAVYRDGAWANLKQAWRNYYNPEIPAKRPKNKNARNSIKSLVNLSGGTAVTLKPLPNKLNALAYLPGMRDRPVKIKGIYKRLPIGFKFGKVTIKKDGGDWYIQFTVPVERPQVVCDRPLKPLGIDPGVKAVVATSNGQVIKPRKKSDLLVKRLKRMQRKAARQYRMNGNSKTKGWWKTQDSIKQLHSRDRRSRKAFNFKLADWLGRFDIAFEGSRLQNMTRKAKPKKRADGKGWEQNGAKRKSGLNRSLLDNGLGQIRQLTENRCKSRGRQFVKTKDKDVYYSSQRCHCCGELGKRHSQTDFYCLNRDCRWHGLKQHADVNAAKNHVQAGYSLSLESYPGATGEVMRVESGATQAGQPGSPALRGKGNDARSKRENASIVGRKGFHEQPNNQKSDTSTVTVVQQSLALFDSVALRDTADKQHSKARSRSKPKQVLTQVPQDACQLSLLDDAV